MKHVLTSIVLSYLRFLTKKALVRHNPTIIGIAGSVGKSSARNALHAILKDHFPTKYVGNSETGIPLGILGITPKGYTKLDWLRYLTLAPFGLSHLSNTKYLIAEMGIDEPLPPKNMGYLLTILKPEIAVSLNITATHTMQFEKMLSEEQKNLDETERLEAVLEKIAEDDTKIITHSQCEIGIYNADDSHIVAKVNPTGKNFLESKLLSFGKEKDNDISYERYEVDEKGTKFEFIVPQLPRSPKLSLTFPNILLPMAYQETFAAVILAGLQTDLTLDQIRQSLEKNFTLPKGRSSMLEGINRSLIIDSSYNASRAAMTTFLNLLKELKQKTKRPTVFLFGDMRELGEESRHEHRIVAEHLIGIVDYLYLVGPQTREHVLPTYNSELITYNLKQVRWFDSSKRAGEYLKGNVPSNAIILVKGSQNTIFPEEAIKYILKDKKDVKNLCRQEAYWMKIKKKVYNGSSD